MTKLDEIIKLEKKALEEHYVKHGLKNPFPEQREREKNAKKEHYKKHAGTKPFLETCGSAERPVEFVKWAKLILNGGLDKRTSAKYFWTEVYEEWSGFDRINHAAFEKLFLYVEKFRPKNYIADIPKEGIIVYRGQDLKSRKGLSWTTDLEIARGFAIGHRLYNPNPIVLSATVKPETIAFFTNDREESEIVLMRRDIATVHLETLTPERPIES
jgi:hypothetical protein